MIKLKTPKIIGSDRFIAELEKHEAACQYADDYLDNLTLEEVNQYLDSGVTDPQELLTLVYQKAYDSYFYSKSVSKILERAHLKC
jgi:tRNA(Glu) U13 pseudouridine synthase TruD